MSNNLFNNSDSVSDSVKKLLEEQTVPTRLIPKGNTIALNFIDISDINKPIVVFKGAGTVPYDARDRYIGTRLQLLAQGVSKGMSMISLRKILADPKFMGGDLTVFYVIGFAEAEELMNLPATKAKLTKAKKAAGA